MTDGHYRPQFDAAMQEFDRYRAKARERAEMVREKLPSVSVDARSPDGAVSLTVNADGMLTGLRMTDRVRDLAPAEIADAVLRTYGAAQRDAASRVAELLEPLSDGYLPDKLRWRQEFDPSPPPVAPTAKPDVRDEEDFGQKSYLRKKRR